MNERIRELWSQAEGRYISGNQYTWPEYTIDDPEKFAELIVKKCIQMIENEASTYAEPVWAFELVNDIQEQFGIES